jgi:NitT/TauT family transport system permease protein
VGEQLETAILVDDTGRHPDALDVGGLARTARRRESLTVRICQLLLLGALLLLWQLASTRQWVAPVLAKTPGDVWDYLHHAASSGELWKHTSSTMTAVLIAFVLAGAVGVIAGIALALLPRTERVVSPFLDAVNSMPRIALAPVFIIYFGINTSAKVALAFSVVVFMMISAAGAGVRTADGELLRMSTVLGASKPQIVRKVLLPVSVPAIFAGLRLGLIYSLLAVVASEILASREGLGQLIARYSGSFQLEGVYGILLVLAVLAMTLNQAMVAVERRILRWQPPAHR